MTTEVICCKPLAPIPPRFLVGLVRAAYQKAMLQTATTHTSAPPLPTRVSAQVLRVCADPDNLPFSNERGEGFENKIAEVIAQEPG
jgi:hypothetical protein